MNFESLIFFHENSWKRMNNTSISHLNLEKNQLWKFDIFQENSWKRIKNTSFLHLNLEKNDFWKFNIYFKEWNLKVWYFYMKIHESAWIILESNIWTGKRTNFKNLIFLHENSWKRMNNTWISHLNREKNEFWKFDIFSWKFMKTHE